jgi:hypothetical protein
MPILTQSELPRLLRRYVNVRLAGGDGGQRQYVDIAAAWHPESDDAACKYPDCDIRGLTGAGIDRAWDGDSEVIRWELIRRVTVGEVIRDADGFLEYQPRKTYHVIAARAAVQVMA